MKLTKFCVLQAMMIGLLLLNCSVLLCTVAPQVVAQGIDSQAASVYKAGVTDAVAGDAASAASPAQAVLERPPRPSRPAELTDTQTHLEIMQAVAEDECWTDVYVAGDAAETAAPEAESSEQTGLGSSTWTQTPHTPAVSHELSIEPATLDLLPEDAPAWVGRLPDLSQDVHRLFVGGQIAESENEAAAGLDAPLIRAVRKYVEEDLLRDSGTSQALAEKITSDYVWLNLIDHRSGYVAKLNTPGQAMYQKWVTVSITPEQRGEIQRWHREAVQLQRLAPIGVGFTSMLACVGLLHLLLRRKPGPR